MSSAPVERERYSKAPTYPDLAGKVAVVTGGSGGIGGATCRLLAANGVKVAINGRDEAKISAVVDDIRSTGGEALGVAADCTDLAAGSLSPLYFVWEPAAWFIPAGRFSGLLVSGIAGVRLGRRSG